MRKLIILAAAVAMSLTGACTRIETGTVGVRTDGSRNVEREEKLPGSWNQVLIGDIDTFPVKDVNAEIRDVTPLAADNSTVKDFDFDVVYSINPTKAADLYIAKSRSFHAESEDGSVWLMYNRIVSIGRAAAYKAVRKYESLKLNDNRAAIEDDIKREIVATLREEKLDTDINVSQVLVRQILPADSVVASANDLVVSLNANKKKAVEVQTAKLEAERIAALNANAGATKYMEATAIVTIAEAIKDGKVKSIVVPYDFKGIINTN